MPNREDKIYPQVPLPTLTKVMPRPHIEETAITVLFITVPEVLHTVRDHETVPRDRTHSIATSDSGRPLESIASCVAASLTTSETVPLRPS